MTEGSRPIDMVMPMFSETMTEGTIVAWLKQPGDVIAVGEDLVEIETDKATMTYPSDTAGVLVEVLAHEGETLPVGSVIARIEVAGVGDGSGGAAARPAPSLSAPLSSADEPGTGSPESGGPARQPGRPGEDGVDRPDASPSARIMANRLGVDLATVRGSGPGGRIVREDVEAAAASFPERPGSGPR